jgi:hypothetical protein
MTDKCIRIDSNGNTYGDMHYVKTITKHFSSFSGKTSCNKNIGKDWIFLMDNFPSTNICPICEYNKISSQK